MIIEPTDAIVRTVATCVCGSDLWSYCGINEIRTKYRRYAARYISPMVSPEVRAATIKLVPRSTTT